MRAFQTVVSLSITVIDYDIPAGKIKLNGKVVKENEYIQVMGHFMLLFLHQYHMLLIDREIPQCDS